MNDTDINMRRLFQMSCIALCVTAMTFAMRAGMLNDLGSQFNLTKKQLGWTASMAFFGFPIATVFGGLIYNSIGPRKIMILAFLGHVLGLILTIFSGGFWGLMISTFCIGFANGSVEAACNPMIANLYSDNKTTMLNKFHVWFPGGIVVGSLAAIAVKKLFGSGGSTWQLEIAVMLMPTLIYGWMILKTKFPEIQNDTSAETNTKLNIRAMISPLFLFMCLIMTITATTELGTQQWIGTLLQSSGANPLAILALVTGLMAVGRYFAGPLVHTLNPVGVLFFSAIISALGVFMLSIASGPLVYAAAIIFAIGVCYFWPTMIGFISEYMPKTGALGMSIVGGAGMMGLAMWQPIIGGWLDTETVKATELGLTETAAQLAAGQATLGKILFFPIVLIFAFGLLLMIRRKFNLGVAND